MISKDQLKGIKINENEYKISFKDIELGRAVRDVDGFFYWWDNRDLHGCTQSWVLREIANKLDELNSAWEKQINEYFAKES